MVKGHGDVHSTFNKTNEKEVKHDAAQQNMELFNWTVRDFYITESFLRLSIRETISTGDRAMIIWIYEVT